MRIYSRNIIFRGKFIFLIYDNQSVNCINTLNDLCEIEIINNINCYNISTYYKHAINSHNMSMYYKYHIIGDKICNYYQCSWCGYQLCSKNDYLKFIYTSNVYDPKDSVVENNKFYLNCQIYDHNFKNITFNSYFNKKILMPVDIKMIFN